MKNEMFEIFFCRCDVQCTLYIAGGEWTLLIHVTGNKDMKHSPHIFQPYCPVVCLYNHSKVAICFWLQSIFDVISTVRCSFPQPNPFEALGRCTLHFTFPFGRQIQLGLNALVSNVWQPTSSRFSLLDVLIILRVRITIKTKLYLTFGVFWKSTCYSVQCSALLNRSF